MAQSEGLKLDVAALLRSVGGDREFLSELIGVFLAASPALLSEMREALRISNFVEIKHATRILKSLLRNFSVERALKAAEALETAVDHGSPKATEEAFLALEKEVERLTSALANLESPRPRGSSALEIGGWRRSYHCGAKQGCG